MTWKLAGFFARCEGVWPSSTAGRLGGMVGSWGRQRGCGKGWGAGLEGILQSGGFPSLAIVLSMSLRPWGVTMGEHSSLAARAQPRSPPTRQVSPRTLPAHPLRQRPHLSSNKQPEGTASLYFCGSAFCI